MPLMGALSFASRVAPGAGAFELSRASRRRRVAVNVRKSPVAALNAKAETRWTDPPPFPEVSARFETAIRRLRAPARDADDADASAKAPPQKRKRDVFFRFAKFALAGSAVLGASLMMPRAALARDANPVATVAFASTKKEAPQKKDDTRATRGKKASKDSAKGASRNEVPLYPKFSAPRPSADAMILMARRAAPVAAALAAAYAVYATRAFYEKALERSVKTLKSSLSETAAIRLELDATRAELDDAQRARDALAFQLGQSSAEIRSELQSAVLELAKTETELECARRELADAASAAAREKSELQQTIRVLEAEVFALNVQLTEAAHSGSVGDEELEEDLERARARAAREALATTPVRFAVSGVPAELVGNSDVRVGIIGTWNDWSEDANDIVFLEPAPDLGAKEDLDLVATLALNAGAVYEYKFVVLRGAFSDDNDDERTSFVVEWQTGPNRVLAVSVASEVDFVAANDVWSAGTTEWVGGEEHSPVTAHSRAVFSKSPEISPISDFASTETCDVADAKSFAAVKEASNNVMPADLRISDRELVDGVVVERAPGDAGAKKSHPR